MKGYLPGIPGVEMYLLLKIAVDAAGIGNFLPVGRKNCAGKIKYKHAGVGADSLSAVTPGIGTVKL